MTTRSLDIGADVYCKDGSACGVLHQVIIDDSNERITDLIIELDSGKTRNSVVPVALVDELDDQGVHLCVREETLETYPEYEYNRARQSSETAQ